MPLKNMAIHFDRFKKGLKERMSENLRATPMLDVHRAEGTFIAWGFFLILIMTIGAVTCNTIKEPSGFKAMSVFLWVLLPLLITVLFTGIRNKQKMVMLIKSGILTSATITSRHEVKRREDVITSYYYLCKFEVHKQNGTTSPIEASLPEKITDQYKTGDSLKVRYSPKDPRLCIEEPSENIRFDLLSKRTEGHIFAIGLICLCISFWGLSSVVSESIAQSGQDASWGQRVLIFFKLWMSHPSDRLQLEIFLFLISISVLGCAVYLLLSPTSRKIQEQSR